MKAFLSMKNSAVASRAVFHSFTKILSRTAVFFPITGKPEPAESDKGRNPRPLA
jgi:hypothetical protein